MEKQEQYKLVIASIVYRFDRTAIGIDVQLLNLHGYLFDQLGIGTGNPGVFQGYPYPYRRKPVPVPKGTGTGTGFAKTRGYATRVRVCLQNQPKNLATAVQVSIDTAVQHCEDRKDESGAVVQSMHPDVACCARS